MKVVYMFKIGGLGSGPSLKMGAFGAAPHWKNKTKEKRKKKKKTNKKTKNKKKTTTKKKKKKKKKQKKKKKKRKGILELKN